MEWGVRGILIRKKIGEPVLAALLCLAVTEGLLPQERLLFRRYSIEHGLSQNSVYAILQDRIGFMWFGTQDGLNRFDGNTFRIFRPIFSDPTSLSNGFVTALTEDVRGFIWAGTDNGNLNRYDPASETFRHFRPIPDRPPDIVRPTITSILSDSKGCLWIGTMAGLALFDPIKEEFRIFRAVAGDPSTMSENRVSALLESTSGELWVGTEEGGLNLLDPESGRARRFLPGESVRAIQEDQGFLWVGTDRGVVRLDPRSGREERFVNDPDRPESLAHNRVTSVIKDQKGEIWIGTRNGLDRWDRSLRRFVHYKNDIFEDSSLSDNDILSMALDRCGGLWVGTLGGGLNRLDRISIPFRHYKERIDAPNRRARNQIWAIMEEEDGTVWVGTAAGLHTFNRRTGVRFNFEHDPRDPGSLGQNIIRSVVKDRWGVVWIGTEGRGIDRLNPGARSFLHYRHDPADSGSLSSNDVRYLLEDRDGSIWAATLGGGVNRFDRASGRFVHYRNDQKDPESLSVDRTYSLCQDREGFIWVATWGGGLDRLDPKTGRCIHYRHNPNDPHSLSDNGILSVMEDRAGNIWVGTRGSGLCKLEAKDREKGKFRTFSEKDGLPNNQIYAVLEDEAGFLWMSHNRGLSRLDPSTGKIKNFGLAGGIQSPEFNGNSWFKSARGELFFGGINGFNAFFPSEIRDNPYPPPVAVTDLHIFNRRIPVGRQANGRTILERSIVFAPSLKLTHKENMITFEFAALHYAVPEENQFAYRLEGYDREWVAAGNSRAATYTNLPPGRYVFQVRAANPDGLWNKKGVSISLTIVPPFWKMLWFQAVAALLIVGILVGAVGQRIREQARNRRRLESMVEERTKEMTAANLRLQDEIKERQRLMRELQRLSVTDELTGLFNRRGFQAFGAELLKMSRRIGAGVFTLYVDFDRLKSINDLFGHTEGDKALADVADLLKRTFRETDVLARVGGDEFAVLGILDRDSPMEILLERLERLLEELNASREDPRRISLSVGVLATVDPKMEIDDLLLAADRKMYEQKRLKTSKP